MFQQRLDERPKARHERLAVQRVGDELVIYDQVAHQAHLLVAEAASVWQVADGGRTSADIAALLGCGVEAVNKAVDELRAISLVEQKTSPGLSRRDAAKRIAKFGSAALVAPLIYSINVGPASAAGSCVANGQIETTNCSGNGSDSKCCSAHCRHSTGSSGTCCGQTGASCSTANDCCSQTCQNTGVCA